VRPWASLTSERYAVAIVGLTIAIGGRAWRFGPDGGTQRAALVVGLPAFQIVAHRIGDFVAVGEDGF